MTAVPMLLLMVQVSLPQRPADTMLGQSERAYLASSMYTAVRLYFAHLQDVTPLDLDSAYRAFLDRALASADRRSFDLAALTFFGALRNGHTWFDDRWLWDNYGQPLGFAARTVSGRWLVTASAVPALRVGDEITAIDEESFESFFQRCKRYLYWSSDHAMRRGFTSRAFLFPPRFTLSLAGRPPVQITRGDADVQRPSFAAKWLEPGRVGYVRIPSFDAAEYEDSSLAAISKFRSSEAIVVDVRGNGGGVTPERLLAALMDRPYRTPRESTPLRVALFDFYRDYGLVGFNDLSDPQLLWGPRTIPPDSSAYTGRLVILVDAGCYSACEDFVMPLKDNGRAVLVGLPTGGSTGQPYRHDYGNGMRIAVGTKRVYLPDGSRFEGVGIEPDITVPLTQDDLHRGRDRAMEIAGRTAVAPRDQWDKLVARPAVVEERN